jgi:hypothetical protein
MISNNRRVDMQPRGITQCVYPFFQVERSVKVSVAGVATVQTPGEPSILGSFREDLMASIAGFGGVRRKDRSKNNALPCSLILYEAPKLMERPVREQSIQFFSSSPLSYALQIFHNDNIPCIQFADYTLADFMIETPHEPFLPSRKIFEVLSGRLSAFPLEFTSQSLKFCNMSFNSPEKPGFGRGGQIIYTQVDPNNFRVKSGLGNDLPGNNDVQKQILCNFAENSTPYPPVFIGIKVVLGNIEINLESFINSGKRAFSRKIKGIRTLIILNRKLLAEVYPSVSAGFFDFKSKFDSLARELGRQFGKAADLFVCSLMEGFPRIYFIFESIIVGKLGGLTEFHHCVDETLGKRYFQADGGLAHHRKKLLQRHFISINREFVSAEEITVAIPPINKWMGFLATIG